MFIYLVDVPGELGPPGMVSRTRTTGLPAKPNWYPRADGADAEAGWVAATGSPELHDAEVRAAGPAGTVVAWEPGTFHRGTALTLPRGARYTLHLGYRPARVTWGQRMPWVNRSHEMEWYQFVHRATPRQLALFDFPPPGHPYWTEATLTGTAQRYPGLDMTPWRRQPIWCPKDMAAATFLAMPRGEAAESLALGALDWLLGSARSTEEGLTWAATVPGAEANFTLYHGSAGIVLALLEAQQHFRDDRYGDAALRGAAAIAAAADQEENCSLYFGLAGMAVALHAVHARLGDSPAGTAARRALDQVRSRADGWHDLVELALQGAADVVARDEAGPEGFLVPHSDPQHRPDLIERYSYGWCNGPAGDAQVFRLLGSVTGDAAWAALADRCWHTVTRCGLPRRIRPGFWDNSGRCCGTAGVLALACDRHAERAESLNFAGVLVEDLAARAIVTAGGVRWSNHEHRATPSMLDPRTGWAMGNAGIIRELLRFARASTGRDRPTQSASRNYLAHTGLGLWNRHDE